MASPFVAVAKVARPHGIRGELRVVPYNEDSEILLGKPHIRLALPSGDEREAVISSVRRTNKAFLVEIVGVVDRNGSEALRGAEVLVRRDVFAELDDDEFYACDVEGARVVLRGGDEVGRVKTLATYPTCHVLVVDRGGGRTLEVPLVDAYVANIDVDQKVVELVTIDGLD